MTNFSDIMVDLELMGLSTDAAIISIGAVRFDIGEGILGDTFYSVVNLKSSVRDGGKIEPATVIWWLEQCKEAQAAVLADDSVLIDVALRDFSNWVREKPLEGLWGNGAGFDNVILNGAYLRKGWTPAWTYQQNRCYRTMAAMCPEIPVENFLLPEEVQHHALHDALAQARHLCAIWKEMKLCHLRT